MRYKKVKLTKFNKGKIYDGGRGRMDKNAIKEKKKRE